jgi:hypothetical protein
MVYLAQVPALMSVAPGRLLLGETPRLMPGMVRTYLLVDSCFVRYKKLHIEALILFRSQNQNSFWICG